MADEEKEQADVSDDTLMAEVTSRGNEVTALLNKREKTKALLLSLSNPPMQAKASEIKDANAAIIEKCLSSMTEPEINATIDSMDIDTCEIFLKYVYKFMGKSTNCGLMLKLHSTLTDRTGLGGIIRVLTHRRQV